MRRSDPSYVILVIRTSSYNKTMPRSRARKAAGPAAPKACWWYLLAASCLSSAGQDGKGVPSVPSRSIIWRLIGRRRLTPQGSMLPCRRCGANNCNNWLGLEVGGAPTPNKVQHGGRVAVFQLTLFGFGMCDCLVEAPHDFMAQGFAAADYGGTNKDRGLRRSDSRSAPMTALKCLWSGGAGMDAWAVLRINIL